MTGGATLMGERTLVDLADRLLDKGASLTGEATISVADVDLIYLGLDLVLASVETVRGTSLAPDAPGAMTAQRYARVRAELPKRVAVDPDDVERGLARLVLTIVEFVRQLLERQAVRRMESGGLTDEEVERVGVALMRLEAKLDEMAARFGLARADLRLSLGPVGELL